MGFVRKGSTYAKDKIVIDYDGVYWYLNGERIEDDMKIIKEVCTRTSL